MSDELWRMSAVEAVTRLKKRELSPLELVEASARRIAEVEPEVNALPTLCLDRARDHARRIMQVAPPAKPPARLVGSAGCQSQSKTSPTLLASVRPTARRS